MFTKVPYILEIYSRLPIVLNRLVKERETGLHETQAVHELLKNEHWIGK